MLLLTPALPVLSPELCLYYSKDSLVEDLPVLIFYGPSTIGNTTQNTSRIQSHVFTLAGFQSFSRLTIAPTSPLYAAVHHLPSDFQGDEVYRGLAVSLLSYFAALSKEIKASLRSLAGSRRPNGVAPMMFDEMHAGELAAKMEQVELSGPILRYLTTAASQQSVSWLDMDVNLPAGTIKRAIAIDGEEEVQAFDENSLPLFDYGQYDPLIRMLGTPTLQPTSQLKRAPSRPTTQSRNRILSKDAKISLRREMCELVDTENTYLGKLSELVKRNATSFRQQSDCGDVDALFPRSLDQILKLSEGFYDEIQTILDTTEDEAIRDIEGLIRSESKMGNNDNPSVKRDLTGATIFSKALLEWFPRFHVPYQNFLRASTEFAKIISEHLNNVSSTLSTKINDIGEQRLRSALIEPVQRLPRYCLLIDNMANHLPSSHPALPNLLKARDVVTHICTLDTSTVSDGSSLSRTLSTIVQDWPASLSMKGHLIAAVDVIELDPPYEPLDKGNPGMILLFQDRLVLLDKLSGAAMSARGVLAEVDRPVMQAQINHYLVAENNEKTLGVSECFELTKTQITESSNGRLIVLTDLSSSHHAIHSTTHFKVFCLQGPYESKAARFSEEIAKARIEGRYTDVIRESGKWALQTLADSQNLSFLTAFSENGQLQGINNRKSWGKIIVSVDNAVAAKSTFGASVMAHITMSDPKHCFLAIEAPNQIPYKADCTIENVVSTFLQQLREILITEHQHFIDYQTSYYRAILKALPICERQVETKHHSHRPVSPIKLLSKVFGSDIILARSSTKSSPDAPMTNASTLLKPSSIKEQRIVEGNIEPKDPDNKVTLLDANAETYRSPLTVLEDTFFAYVVALRSRSGNVVGRILRNRAAADELVVNELYNSLLEDPTRLQMAAEVSVDVLFAAFERFLRVAWRERMGPLIAPMAIQNLQLGLDAGRPTVFAQDFRNFLEEMSPQGRRCLAATVKLLSELLDASGNDGDRGVLIASFAEALVLVGNPHEYITLLDRLVDDYDHLFEDAVDKPGSSGSATGSLNRTRSINTGSFSSNASSLRKKFGLGGGLSRENSKTEPESKVTSIWRTMSKNTRSPRENNSQGNSQPGSMSKASLTRSRSTETVPKWLPPLQPDSRERPSTSSSKIANESQSRPGSSYNTISILSSIGESAPNDPTFPNKKKRRSSLSDLVKAQASVTSPLLSPLQPHKSPPTVSSGMARELPRPPSPRRPSLTTPRQKPSPKSEIPKRLISPQRKDISQLGDALKESSPSPRTSQEKMRSARQVEEIAIASRSPQKRATSRSKIPSPRTGGLSERTWQPNNDQIPPKKPTTDGSPKKLRIQSPQKIRERQNLEQKAIAEDQISLQNEITKISDELSTFKLPIPASTKSSASNAQRQTLESLSVRLDALSKSLKTFTTKHTTTTHSLRADLENSLLHAERKARKLDDLYKEANAENEALYERFNDELGKVLGRVKKGEGVEEMRDRMNQALKEVASLKSERAKLLREVAGLKALVKG